MERIPGDCSEEQNAIILLFGEQKSRLRGVPDIVRSHAVLLAALGAMRRDDCVP